MAARRPRLSHRLFHRGPQRLLALWDGDRSPRYVSAALRQLEAPEPVWRRRQARRLRAFLLHAYRTSPWWHERIRAAGLDPKIPNQDPHAMLAALPRLDRSTVISNAEGLISRAIPERDLVRLQSGGTTGAPMPFVQARRDNVRKEALATAMQYLMGWFPGARQAFLWGAMQDLPDRPRSRLGLVRRRLREEWLERQLLLPSNDLSPATMDAYLDRLETFRPEWLQGYPHATDILARHAIRQGRSVAIPNITMTAEPTTLNQRERIHEAFGAQVSTWYGAREHGWIGAECSSEGRLHVNHVGVYLEQADDGAVLVTDLLTHGMPLIRYELGDRVVLGTSPCPCGDPRPTIDKLEGRVTDVLTLPSGRSVPGVLTNMRGLQHFVPGVIENQVVQNDLYSLDVYYVPASNFEPAHELTLADDIRTTTFNELEIRCHAVSELRRAPNGKVRYCVSHVSRDDGT